MRRSARDPHDDPASDRNRAPPGPVPTIGDLIRHKHGNWVCVYCRNDACSYSAPAALVPLAIRFGMNASSDMLRERVTCLACVRRGAPIMLTRWNVQSGANLRWAIFPTFHRDGLWDDRPIGPPPQWTWSDARTVPRPAVPRYFKFARFDPAQVTG